MLSYKLAKQLKDAGFPQKVRNGNVYHPTIFEADIDAIYFPTLEELIEWCGGEFDSLISIGDKWMACGGPDFKLMGKTPSISMALLGLKLHKK